MVVLGPTASGKTRLAVQAARRLGGEILSVDSRQVYRGLDLGSGKDLAEYGEIPYHLIDLVEPGYEYSLFDYVKDFSIAYAQVRRAGRLPLLVGGTGLYLDALLRGYRLVEAPEDPALRRQLADCSLAELQTRLQDLRPEQHNTTDFHDRQRLVRAIEIATAERSHCERPLQLPDLAPRIYGLRWPRAELRARITRRLKERLEAGLIDEVAALRQQGVSDATLEFYGLEYRFVGRYLQGLLSRNDLFQKLNSAIHQFAKRQDTWFRRMERHGLEIVWLDPADAPLERLLSDWQELQA